MPLRRGLRNCRGRNHREEGDGRKGKRRPLKKTTNHSTARPPTLKISGIKRKSVNAANYTHTGGCWGWFLFYPTVLEKLHCLPCFLWPLLRWFQNFSGRRSISLNLLISSGPRRDSLRGETPEVKSLVYFLSCSGFVTPHSRSLTLPSLRQTADGNDDGSNDDVVYQWSLSGTTLCTYNLCYFIL